MQKRRRFKQTTTLEERLAGRAMRLREEAGSLPPGPARAAIEGRARQADAAAHLSEWLTTPGLQPLTGKPSGC
jgi:hypothetical protein